MNIGRRDSSFSSILNQAYDSVPRAARWLILAKAGPPAWLITIIRSFHDGLEAVVAMAGGTTQPIC